MLFILLNTELQKFQKENSKLKENQVSKTLFGMSQTGKSIETENRLAVALALGRAGRARGGVTARGDRVLSGDESSKIRPR